MYIKGKGAFRMIFCFVAFGDEMLRDPTGELTGRAALLLQTARR